METNADVSTFPTVTVPTTHYLTAVEAAAYLRTTRGTVYNLVWRGLLPRRRGKLLFTRAELDAYVTTRSASRRRRKTGP